ncbi:MAG: hypothetical protein ACI8QC_000522, partial [Planctomycetota bacterium]
ALEGLGFNEWAKPAAPRPLPKPTLPDDYELIEEIGRGGMGVVWRARQTSLDREVAVKVLMPGELVFGEALERFRREAKSLARLRHRHIVRVHDVGEHGGHVFFVMDLVEGQSLAQALAKESPMGVAQAVRILRQTTSAIAYVHERGLVHRDLKPGNILIGDDGDAYVVDFGLALDRSLETELTATGNLLGTPAYMAPEQARGDRKLIGEASDVYALGAILYECLGGSAPFAGLAIAELVHAVLHEEPKPLAQRNPQVPAPLTLVTAKAMAKDPKDRYPTAKALLEDLERFEEGRSVRAEPPKMRREFVRWVRRERTLVMAVLATFVLTFGLLHFGARSSVAQDPMLVLARKLVEEGKSDVAAPLFSWFLHESETLEVSELVLGGMLALTQNSEPVESLVTPLEGRAQLSFQDPRVTLLASASAYLRGDTEQSGEYLDRAQSYADSLDQLQFFELLRDPLRDPAHTHHQTWMAFLWEAMERPRLAANILLWFEEQGPSGLTMLLELMRANAANGTDLRVALAPEKLRSEQAWLDFLSARGRALLPHLIALASDPDAAAATAALHMADAIAGLSASPWGGDLVVEPKRLLTEIKAWPARTPAQRDLARLTLALEVQEQSPQFPGGFYVRHFGSSNVSRVLPATAAELSEVMGASLELEQPISKITTAALLERFHASSRYDRRLLHRLLTHRFVGQAPLWPLGMGKRLMDPRGLADHWQSLVHPGADKEPWSVRWAWLEVSHLAGPPTLVASGRLPVQRSTPFQVEAERSAPIKAYESRNVLGPSYLGYGPRGPNPVEWVTLAVNGRAGFASGGMRLKWGHSFASMSRPRWNIRTTSSLYRDYEPGEVHTVARAARWGEQSIDWPEQSQVLVAVLESSDTQTDWTAQDWSRALEQESLVEGRPSSASITKLRAEVDAAGGIRQDPGSPANLVLWRSAGTSILWSRVLLQAADPAVRKLALKELQKVTLLPLIKDQLREQLRAQEVTAPDELARSANPIRMNRTNLIVLGSLAAFVLLSVLLGSWAGIRALLRRGISWSKIVQVGSLVGLVTVVFVSMLLSDTLGLLTETLWMNAFMLWGAFVFAWFALPRKRSGPNLRIPALMFGIAAVLACWHALNPLHLIPLAWATLLAPCAVLVCLMVLEIELRHRGFRRGKSAVLAWIIVLGVFSSPLLSGLALSLQTIPLDLAQDSGAALDEAMRSGPFLVWLQNAQHGPFAGIWFQVLFWSFHPITRQSQQGGNGMPHQKVAKIRFRSKP